MSKYQFEGDYKRKPNVMLGGRSVTETKNAVILKAQNERKKRDTEKKQALAIVKIQAGARSWLARKSFKNALRQEFDASVKTDLDVEGMGLQLKRVNLFYASSQDNERLHELAKRILHHHEAVIDKVVSDVVWLVRMRTFLVHCLQGINSNRGLSRIFIRLIEVFTDTNNSKLMVDIHIRKHNFIPELWAELVGRQHFYDVWRVQMETQLLLNRDYIAMPLPFADSLVSTLVKPLNMAKFLIDSPSFFIHVNGIFMDSYSISAWLVKEFVLSFATKSISSSDPKTSLFTNFIIPRLKAEFPHKLLINTLLQLELADNQRHVLYTLLLLADKYVSALSPNSVEFDNFMKVVQSYIQYVDSRYLSLPEISSSYMVEHDEDSEEEMEVDIDQRNYVQESSQVLQKLIEVFNMCTNLASFFDQLATKWTDYCPIVSCLFRQYQIGVFSLDSPYKVDFLLQLSSKKSFIRALFHHQKMAGVGNQDGILSFCWLYQNFTVTLHDSEFIVKNPLNVPELDLLVTALKNYYSDSVINDTSDRLAKNVNKAVVRLLMILHDRNTRLLFLPENTFVSAELSSILPLETHLIRFDDFEEQSGTERFSLMEMRLFRILREYPFLLNFHSRVTVTQRLISVDRAHRFMPYDFNAHHIQIRRNYIYEDAFEKLSVENVPDMRGNVRISLVNVVGMVEAGVDGGGLLREFLTEATKAGVDPNRGLFRLDSQNRLYPNPIAKHIVPGWQKHFILIGRLVGKALYEQTLLELPLAAFFLESCIAGHVTGAVDYLATLDPALHKNLLALKNYSDEELNQLGLDFTLTTERLGDTHSVELKPNGASISVCSANVIEYIHLVADYKINKETREECEHFTHGLVSVCPIPRLFTWRELQTLISGSDKPIDIDDWKAHTNYTGGYEENHPMIKRFWEVVKTFEERNLRKLLKFVTSCSRPPLLGFKDLVPNFGIQSAGVTDRLPSAATCMNLLKLPEYRDPEVLREKLIYAIDSQSGFELS